VNARKIVEWWVGLVRSFWRGVDGFVARGFGVWCFTDRPDSILRIALMRNTEYVKLSDGTVIAPGEQVGELHLWNDHLPHMPPSGPDLAWAKVTWRKWLHSLGELAAYVEKEPSLAHIRAFHGETVFLGKATLPWVATLQRIGFDVTVLPAPHTFGERFVAFFRNGYAWTLIWTYNPGSLQRKDFSHLERFVMWISRKQLLSRYGGGQVTR
jgi:hypothetical protein